MEEMVYHQILCDRSNRQMQLRLWSRHIKKALRLVITNNSSVEDRADHGENSEERENRPSLYPNIRERRRNSPMNYFGSSSDQIDKILGIQEI
jgi:hypothetical protein